MGNLLYRPDGGFHLRRKVGRGCGLVSEPDWLEDGHYKNDFNMISHVLRRTRPAVRAKRNRPGTTTTWVLNTGLMYATPVREFSSGDRFWLPAGRLLTGDFVMTESSTSSRRARVAALRRGANTTRHRQHAATAPPSVTSVCGNTNVTLTGNDSFLGPSTLPRQFSA